MKSRGSRLRLLRKRRGWSGTEFARRLAISPSYMSKLERGVKSPPCWLRARMAQALGRSRKAIDELFGKEV
jgi:transcriptional regulator with XRE-family HTH domain